MWQGSFAEVVERELAAANAGFGERVTQDRESTIGSSDIGGCGLRAIRSKRTQVSYSAETYWNFLRGHTRERALAALHDQIAGRHGLGYTSQVRVHHPSQRRFRAHIDRVYHDADTISDAVHLRLIEEKCPKEVPNSPWDGWVYQLQWQLGLLKTQYPDKRVDGILYATDLGGNHTDFGIVWVPNDEVFAELLEKGQGLLQHIDEGTEPEAEPGLLCGYCPFQKQCPAYADPVSPPVSEELLAAVADFKDAGTRKKEAEGLYRLRKEQILTVLFPQDPPKKWRGVVGEIAVQYSRRNGRKTCNLDLLEREFPAAYAACVTNGKEYDVLDAN